MSMCFIVLFTDIVPYLHNSFIFRCDVISPGHQIAMKAPEQTVY